MSALATPLLSIISFPLLRIISSLVGDIAPRCTCCVINADHRFDGDISTLSVEVRDSIPSLLSKVNDCVNWDCRVFTSRISTVIPVLRRCVTCSSKLFVELPLDATLDALRISSKSCFSMEKTTRSPACRRSAVTVFCSSI